MQNYQIYEEIGKGKHSVVYKGRRKKSIDYYAIKSIEKTQRDKVLNEVQILHALAHSQVLRFYNWYETNNHLWLIVEYCTGSDLLAILKSDKSLPEVTIQGFAVDVLRGLLYIHSRGILYCDLKPSNLLVDGSGVVKLSDFGLAQLVDNLDYGKKGGRKVGTPCYMAPELFQEDGVHSYSSDHWSLGCVLYELATGKPPFVDKNLEALIHMILHAPCAPPSNLSDSLKDLLQSLFCKDPVERCDWGELVAHPFFKGAATEVPPLPAQPYYEQYVRAKEAEMHDKAVADVTKLSANVKTNMKREQESEEYHRSTHSRARGSDSAQLNPDTEMDFGDHAEEEDTPDTSPPSRDQSMADADHTTPTGDDPQTPEMAELTFAAENNFSIDQPLQKRRPEKEESQPEASSPGRGEGPTIPTTATLPPPEQLLFHVSDTYVKPIMMNNRIEKITDPKFNSEELPFPAHTLATINAFSQKNLEAFLTQVYKSIGGHTKVIDKYHSLLYFQTLCGDTNAANLFINSSLMTLFVKMLQNESHPPNLRVQLCMAMGLLIRHATFISPDLSTSGIIATFTMLLDRSSNDKKVKRRAAACMGELLFYIATQQPEDKGCWDIQQPVISALVDCLRGEDEITRHYVTKTIENIVGHTDTEYGMKFAHPETLSCLTQVFLSPTRNEHLKTAAISAISRLCRIQPQCVGWVLDELGPQHLARVMPASNTRAVQAELNLLLLTLAQYIAFHSTSDPHSQPSFLFAQLTLLKLRPPSAALQQQEANSVFRVSFFEQQHIISIDQQLEASGGNLITSALVGCLEQPSNTIRAKAVMAIFLLAFAGVPYLTLCCDHKLCLHLERLSKEKDTYFVNAFHTLLHLLGVVATSLLSTLALDLEISVDSEKEVPLQTTQNLSVVVHVLTTPSMRSVVVSTAIIEWLSRALAAVEQAQEFPNIEETKRNLFAIVEALSQDAPLVKTFHGVIISHLLPVLATLLDSESGDTRFLCLKLLIDILFHFLNDSDLYSPTNPDAASRALNHLVTEQIFPMCDKLLNDDDPIPLYGLKLMNSVATENPDTMTDLYERGLLPRFFEFFELEHRNNNVHNVKLILKVVECSAIPKQFCYDLGLVRKLTSVLTYAFEKNVESFFEPCLDIVYSLLYGTATAGTKGGQDHQQLFSSNQPLAACVGLYTALALNIDVAVRELAARCALLSVQIYTACHEAFLAPANIQHVLEAISTESDVPVLGKLLLKAVAVVLSASPEQRVPLVRQHDVWARIVHLASSQHPEVATLANQITHM